MLLLVVEDALEQVAADIVADELAMRDRVAEEGDRVVFEREVGLEDDGLADPPAGQLDVGQAVAEPDARGQPAGVLPGWAAGVAGITAVAHGATTVQPSVS